MRSRFPRAHSPPPRKRLFVGVLSDVKRLVFQERDLAYSMEFLAASRASTDTPRAALAQARTIKPALQR